MRWQCSLFSLAFIAYLGVILLSEELFQLDDAPREPSGSFASLRARPGAELFKGRYELHTNGTTGEQISFSGKARMTIGWQRTSILAVQVLSVAVTLVGAEDHLPDLEKSLGMGSRGVAGSGEIAAGRDVELTLRGVELMAAGQAAATGFAGGSALLAALHFRQQWPAGPAALAAARADRAAADAAAAADQAAAAVAQEFFGGRSVSACRLDAAIRPSSATSPRAPGNDVTTDSGAGDAREPLAAIAGGQQQASGIPDTFARAEHLQADMFSPDCGFSLHLATELFDVELFARKVTHYSLWANALTIIQIRCVIAQMRYTDEGTSAAKLSMASIAVQALMDAYDSFLHLSLTASSQYMVNSFALISMFKFILFALLEVRYVLTIWRCRHRDLFSRGWDEVRSHLQKVYSYFYGALVGGLLIIFNAFDHLNLIVLLFQAHWVPQILYDARQGSRAPLQLQFLVVMAVTRCLSLMYLWGCPSGIFSGDIYPALPGAPGPRLCMAIVLLQVLQLGIMVSQQVFGPRWFIPWLCLPNVYNYRRLGVGATTFEVDDCVICMGEMGDSDAAAQQNPVITPCDHRFHKPCLERWMDIKMECPTCRAELPPMC